MTITNSPEMLAVTDRLPTGDYRLPTPIVEHGLPYWYAIYTKPRHEKRVAEQLIRKSVETLLPVYECIRRWKNGRHRVQFPLFPGYAFVRIALKDRLDVIKVPGVIRLVGSDRGPLPLPNGEIEGLRRGLAAGIDVLPHPYLTAGRRIRVVSGPLRGMRGIMIRRKGQYRIVVSLDLIMQSIRADVDVADIRPDEDVPRR
jgi:transcription antitermination factor NusG